MAPSIDSPIRLGWKDQLSWRLFIYNLRQCVLASLGISAVVTLILVLLVMVYMMIFSEAGIAGIRWNVLGFGFVGIAAFIFPFLLLGELVPPAIQIDERNMLFGDDGEHLTICLEDITRFSVQTHEHWYRFTVEYKSQQERASHWFYVVRRQGTATQTDALMRLVSTAD